MKISALLLLSVQISAQSAIIYQSSAATAMTAPQTSGVGSADASVQTGDNNSASIALFNGAMRTLQNGNSNRIFYTETNSFLQSATTIEITGHNNTVDILGNNSISANLQLRMNANNKSVVIRNH